jgi:hypothetical protein
LGKKHNWKTNTTIEKVQVKVKGINSRTLLLTEKTNIFGKTSTKLEKSHELKTNGLRDDIVADEEDSETNEDSDEGEAKRANGVVDLGGTGGGGSFGTTGSGFN